MATSGISNAINSKLRLSGMVSGLDTDSIIKQLMAVEKTKVDKVVQKRDLEQWRMDSYRDVMSTLQGFYNQYFDPISSQNIKSANAFSSFAASFSSPTSTQFVNVTPNSSAKSGAYEISNLVAAKAAMVTGSPNVTNTITTIGTPDVASLDGNQYNNLFAFNYNGKYVQLTLDDTKTDLDGLVQDLQAKINNSIGTDSGSPKVIVEGTGGVLSFRTSRPTDTFAIGTVNNDGAGKLFSTAPSNEKPFSLNVGNNQFELTIDGIAKTITVQPTQDYTDADFLKIAIQSAIDNAFGPDSGVTADIADGKVKLTSPTNKAISIGYTPNTATNTLLKIDTSNMSNKVNRSEKLSTIGGSFVKDPFENTDGSSLRNVDGTFSGNIQFTITSGKGTSTFTFDPTTTSVNDIIKKVNTDTNIDVKMSYDLTTNSFKMQTNTTGSTQKLIITDTSGTMMESLGLNTTATGVTGNDASVDVKDPDGNTITIVRGTNQFTYEGFTFDIKKDLPADASPVSFTVSGDTTKTYDFIKAFVDKYNEVIDKLNALISQKKDRDYMPLTDEQKSAMSEDQIKKWEDKAKIGLLQNDSTISETLSRLRAALYESVDGGSLSLYSIGITTSNEYKSNGKLVISNEKKLKDALANNPENVTKLFTNNSDISYYTALNDTAKRSQRYKETGLAQRFSDIIQDAIRTNTDSKGNKGSLVMKAGLVGDSSEFTNILYKEIMDFNESIVDMNNKLTSKENALYSKFTAMETALNRMNAQSSWIAQQFGGGNS